MSLEPESMSWKHARDLERGDVPLTSEGEAAARLVSLVGTHLDRKYVTERLLRDIAGKIVAARDNARAIFDELDADPRRIGERGDVLQQQQHASLSDEDFFVEQAGYHKRGYEHAMGILAAMGSVYARDHDPDARDADREDDRLREVRQDEHAAEEAPGLAS